MEHAGRFGGEPLSRWLSVLFLDAPVAQALLRTDVFSGVYAVAGTSAGADVLAAWVERAGRRVRKPERAGLRFAFYGRCRRRDWQDPVTSRARQYAQAAARW
jgi:hypothetical protein